MSGEAINSSAGPSMILFVVVILPVAYASRPEPQFRIIFPPVETTVVTERSRAPG